MEIKNDPSIYCPMLGRVEIDYDGNEGQELIDMSIDQKDVSLNVGTNTKLSVKTAPTYLNEVINWLSDDTSIAAVDENGVVTAKKVGSTMIYAKYNDEIYATSVINVLGENMALNKETEASTDTNQWVTTSTKNLVNDGDYNTRWSSKDGSNIKEEYLLVKLDEITNINNVKIYWESARARDYNIEVSLDGIDFTPVKELRNMNKTQLVDDISFDLVEAKYVKIKCLNPETAYGYSIYELEVYDNSNLKKASSMDFSNTLSELYLGEVCPLNVTVTPKDATYQIATYTSNNESVAVIKNDKVIAVGEGTATISAIINGQKVAKDITVVKDNARKVATQTHSLEIENNHVVFPKVDGYNFSIYSSSHEKVMNKEGKINLPVEDIDIKLIVTVSKSGSNDTANTNEIIITVKGNRDKYDLLMQRIKEIEELDWSLYKPKTVDIFKEELTKIKDDLNISILLVSDVENISKNLESIYKILELKSDKKTLLALIGELEHLDAKIYTDISMARVKEVLKMAILVHDNQNATEQSINDAIIALQQVKTSLVEQINYNNLKNKIEAIEKEDLSIYSKETVERLKEQVTKAKIALTNDAITNMQLREELLELNRKYNTMKINYEKGTIEKFINELKK